MIYDTDTICTGPGIHELHLHTIRPATAAWSGRRAEQDAHAQSPEDRGRSGAVDTHERYRDGADTGKSREARCDTLDDEIRVGSGVSSYLDSSSQPGRGAQGSIWRSEDTLRA